MASSTTRRPVTGNCFLKKMLRFQCFIILPVLGACVAEIDSIDLRTFHGDKNGGSFEKIIVYNNVVFVGGRNEIHKLDSNLIPLQKWTGQGCINDELDDATEENIIKVLLVYEANVPLLLSCGSACRGMCRMHNMANIVQFRWIGDPNDKLSYVASKETTVAFFAPGPFNFRNLLYSASTYDNRNLSLSPISVSSKAINFIERKQVSLVYPTISDANRSSTSVDFSERTKTKFIVKYLYGFSYGGYSYFVTRQRVSLNGWRYETRLARICQNDTEFFSYTEVPLKCQRGLDVYNYATTALLGFAGDTLRKRMNMESTEKDILLVAFAATSSDQEEAIDEGKGAIICSFRMSKVIEYFTNATRDCFNAEPRTRLLEFIIGTEQKCIERSDVKIDDRFCGSAFNHYIEGRETIPGGFRVHVDKKQITSIVLTLQADDTVALLGTHDGHVIKVILNRRTDQPLYTMFIGDKDQFDNRIRPSNSLDSSHTNVYFLIGKKVKKFPIGSCSVYKKCSSCISINDPLHCGWCGTHCAHIGECETPAYMSEKLCPPIIHDVSPLMGPVEGGTLVTINGDNFSHSQTNAKINVTVANILCEIIVWENTRLQCKTGGVTSAREGPVVVNVYDGSWMIGEYEINGSAISSISFKYVIPKLYHFTPSFGPNSGGTNVTFEGDLLLVGSSAKVFLAQVECSVYNVSEKEIKCTSGHSHTNQMKQGLALLEIDNAQIVAKADPDQSMFQYLEDPVIHNITPHETTISGGTNVTVVGRNLNSVAFPQMVVTATSTINGKQMEYIQDCFSDKITGRYMICPVPSLEDRLLSSPASSVAPVVTHMAFIMDGVTLLRELPYNNPTLSVLYYFPDPHYEEFQEPNRIRKIAREVSLLDIKGKDLNLAHGLKDIKVIIHESSYCNVTRVTTDTLWCIIPPIQKESNDTVASVEVIAGKLRFDLGYIQFVDTAKEKANTLVAIIIPVLLAIGIMAVLTAVFVCRKLSKKSFHSDLMVTYTAESGSREGSCRRRQGANDYMDMRGRNNAGPPPASTNLPLTYQVDDETLNLLHAENIFFLRDYLTLGKVIGQGHFGRVYKGELQLPGKEEGNSVAVKTLHNSASTAEQDVKAFLQEGLMMKDFHHHNVLTLIGVCFEADGSPMVIIPYMKYGDLLSYIRNENHFPTIKDLLQYGVQIAAGMRYLSDLKFVHRDLAGRNCMLDEDHTVKVADFGLSRDIYERDYYSSDNKKTKLPVKWMAPESLEKGTYNTKTDVWSFGVVLWELMTRGVTPYPDVDNWDVLQYLKKGRRMPQPSYCPDMLYSIMLRCWSEEAKKRPSFAELEEEVQGVITKLEQKSKQRKVGLNVTYVNYPSGAADHNP